MDNFAEFEKKRKYFYERTNKHIQNVQKYAMRISQAFPEFEDLYNITLTHDNSKFQAPELIPYIEINWYYKLKKEGKEYPYTKEANAASYHHITTNSHHPEFHDPNITIKALNPTARDLPGEYIVDGTRMTRIDIAHMCADWAGMSFELGNSPIDWADKMIGMRWKFNKEQRDLIYTILNTIWKE